MSQQHLDLGKLSLPQLEDLLKRQELMLKNRSLISTLPDKGEKIAKFRDKIQEVLEQATLERLEQMSLSVAENQASKVPFGGDSTSKANAGVHIIVQEQLETLSLGQGQGSMATEAVAASDPDIENLLCPFAKKLVLHADSTLDKPPHLNKLNEPLKKTHVSPGHSKSDNKQSDHWDWEGVLQPRSSNTAKQLSLAESIKVSKEKALIQIQKKTDGEASKSKSKSVKFANATTIVGSSNVKANEATLSTGVQMKTKTVNPHKLGPISVLCKLVGDIDFQETYLNVSDDDDLSDDKVTDESESEDYDDDAEKEHRGHS